MPDAKPYLNLSVHGLIDPLLRAGDIDDRVYNQETMETGTLLHSAYQKKQKANYLAEYPLAEVYKRDKGTIALQGRADGIIVNEGESPIIDEIKSTVMPLDEFFLQQKEWHLGQACCYGLMYIHEKGLRECRVRLTYISQLDSKKKEVHDFSFSLEEIEARVYGYIDSYLDRYMVSFNHQKERDKSIESLSFPYEDFRPGQRELAKLAYAVAKNGKIAFAEAPTGIGKTMSTLYPFVKSMKMGKNEKLFYLTAKTIGGDVASDAIGEMIEKGLVIRDSFLVSKEKLCFSPGHACNPDDCPFAKDYYGKVNEAIGKIIREGKRFSRKNVIEVCEEYTICPFEFQLDLSLYADIVICDYNYFFDPLVYLERYFDESVDTCRDIVLIDEAHNLVDRGRAMYSSELTSSAAYLAKKELPAVKPYLSLRRALGKVEKALLSLLSLDEQEKSLESMPEDLTKALTSLSDSSLKLRKDGAFLPSITKDFLREANRLNRLSEEYFTSSSRYYVYGNEKEVSFKLLCLDASSHLREQLERVRSAMLFSATLSPIEYYMKTILGKDDYPYLLLPSPFPKENFHLMINPRLSIRYKDREATYGEVADCLKAFIESGVGNYFIYFPSYDYLNKILPYLSFEGAEVLIQTKKMLEVEKRDFLDNFSPNPTSTKVGLLVLGGAFSEGIDLVDDRLIGVAIVGVGLPMVCTENDLLREYEESRGQDGFAMAYKNPAVNKVMQAVGRLIRSETDIGMALLIDDRYVKGEYRALFSRIWKEYELVYTPERIQASAKRFHERKKKVGR
ncbi:MAG: ATP-dependent DNA helicase [Bacilli bacterium]|nr:ATP-dependent DNA helicase [Bacilli bacterium]